MQALRLCRLLQNGKAIAISIRLSCGSVASQNASSSVETICRDIIHEDDLDKAVQKFIASSEIGRFRCKHKVYEITVRRLRGAGKFSAIEQIIEAQKKYPDISKEGFCVRLIWLYGRSGMFSQARKLFDELPQLQCTRTVKGFNALLSAASDSRMYESIPQLFSQLQSSLSIKADIFSFNILILSYCRIGSLDDALTVLDTLHDDCIQPNLVTFNTLLRALYEEGRFSDADKVWLKMEDCSIVPDIVSFNAKLRGLALHGKVEEAVQLVKQLPSQGLKPDSYSFMTLVQGFCKEGNLEKAIEIYNGLSVDECVPNRRTFDVIIPCLIDQGELDVAFKIAKESLSRKVRVKGRVLQGLVDALARGTMMEKAKELVNSGARKYSLKLPSSDEG